MKKLLITTSLAALLAACGDDPTPATDAGTRPDATPGMDVVDPGPAKVRVHYHRADRDYSGWAATFGGDLSGSALAATGTDGFGAIFEVALPAGATRGTVQLSHGTINEPAAPVELDLGTTTAIWHFHGAEAVLTSAPPAIPGPGQVAVYYKRGDTDYSNWGLHLWGDVVTETPWMGPARPAGVDPVLGAHWLVDVKPAAERVNIIVHKGDEKDPGPDMGWNISELGDIVFVLTGSTEVYTKPVTVPEFSIRGAAAHWLDRSTFAWDHGTTATRFELRTSSTAAIVVDGTEVVGGAVATLSPITGGLPMPLRTEWPHLARMAAFELNALTATRAESLVGQQLVVVARDDAGKALAATAVQHAGVLDALFAYDGTLGATVAADRSVSLRVWAPTASRVRLVRFDSGLREVETLPMTRGARGTWSIDGPSAWYGSYYQYEVTVFHYVSNRVETVRTTDPYSVALSPNGVHSYLVSLDDPATKPAGWDTLVKPPLDAPEDISIYELHVRDFSVDDTTVPAEHRGRFMAFTHNGQGGGAASRGMAHLRALADAGLTVVQLLPSFDYATVEEDREQRVELDDGFDKLCAKVAAVPRAQCTQFGTRTLRDVLGTFDPTTGDAQALMAHVRPIDGFNWGYDPVHYTAPEGSYATNPSGLTRILELRSAVKALAEVGLRISLDVVYNHTNAAGVGARAVLDKLVPGYYHRRNISSGNVETSTCCANTATEHAMMEKLMIDSLVTWSRAYKIDAFRFDLMGHHMKRNMTRALATVQALTPATDGVDGSKIYFYGEGWNFGEVASNARGTNAIQINMPGTGIGTFSDRLRDAVRGGGPFDGAQDLVANQGFISGLYYDSNTNDRMPRPDSLEKLLIASDQIRVGLAGNLRRFKLVTRAGGVSTGNLVGYNGQPSGYTDDPQEVITYVDKHDNQTLFDISAYKTPRGTTMADRARIQALGTSFVTLGQGVPFFHAGMELLRSKSMERDSYDSGDWWNALDYTLERTKWNVGLPREDKDGGNWDIIRGLCMDTSIAPARAHIERTRDHFVELLRIRRSSPLFRLRTEADVMRRVDFYNTGMNQIPGLIAMTISDGTCAGADLDPAHDGVVVMFNANDEAQTLDLPGFTGFSLHPVQAASTDMVVRGAAVTGTSFSVPARTAAVFVAAQAGAQSAGVPCNTR